MLDPELVVSGRVVDEKTGRPIPSFWVYQGRRWDAEGAAADRYYWRRNYMAARGKDGRYRIAINEPAENRVIRVEAPGHAAAVSRAIDNGEGNVTLPCSAAKRLRSRMSTGWS